jgi:hypothetical protein
MAKIFSSFIEQTFTATANQGQFRFEVINVPTAGTPVQLPNLVIPDSVDLVLRAKLPNSSAKIYVANSSLNCADATKRMELKTGESIGLTITNANLVFIDSSVNNGKVELFVEA